LVKPPHPYEEGWAEWYATLPICEDGQDQWPAKEDHESDEDSDSESEEKPKKSGRSGKKNFKPRSGRKLAIEELLGALQ
jgi:hypothetical protein